MNTKHQSIRIFTKKIENNSDFEETFNSQKTVSYTPHVIDTNSNMNIIYQNTTKKIQQPETNLDNPTPIRDPKNINFQSPNLENYFKLIAGAESKFFSQKKSPNTIPDPDRPIYAKCDNSNFGIGAALLQ